jgi:hypothetical protein
MLFEIRFALISILILYHHCTALLSYNRTSNIDNMKDITSLALRSDGLYPTIHDRGPLLLHDSLDSFVQRRNKFGCLLDSGRVRTASGGSDVSVVDGLRAERDV